MNSRVTPTSISETRLRALVAVSQQRGLPVPTWVREELARQELGRRGLVSYPTFEDFVRARRPELLRHRYMQVQVDVAQRVIRGELTRVLVLLPTQYGKALADDTPIPTPEGFRLMGELRVGDAVFAADGTVARVIAVPYRGVRPTYWVTAEDGGAVRAADTHDWTICLPDGTRTTRSTEDLAQHGVRWSYAGAKDVARAVRIPVAAAVQCAEAALPIAPYTLGLWLGDGANASSYLTIGHQDIAAVRRFVRHDGYRLQVVPSSQRPGVGAYAYLPVSAGGKWDKRTSLQTLLRTHGLLHAKHIPPVYFRASVRQRLALLQGLVDSDGHVARRTGRVEFSNTCERLAYDVQALVHSLGAKAFVTEGRARFHGEDCGPVWTVAFYLPDAARLSRKAQHLRAAYTADANARTKAARAVTFTPASPCAVTCITIDRPDGLFLAGRNMMVTHNSEIWSRLFPAYYLLTYPARTVALGSYGAELAWELSGEARDHYAAAGGRFREGSPKGATRNWRTERVQGLSGGMWATGVGGPALGRGWHLGVVDDPVDPEQAGSPAFMNRFKRWWPAKWLRGQRPRVNAMVFVMQRLSPTDPVTYLLDRELTDAAERWHILAFDEVKSDEPFGRYDGPRGFPSTCTVEPDWRQPNEVLAPTFRTDPEVRKLHATAGPVVAAAQRQQRPMRPTGDFWALKWFADRTYAVLPSDAHNGGWDWDTAYTKEAANSASAGIKSYRGAGDKDTFRIYIEDVWWDWLEFPALVAHLKSVTGPHYVEKKASGKSVVQVLGTYDVRAEEVPVRGDKLARASAAQPAVTQGRVYVNERVLQKLLYGEGLGLLRITAEALQGDGGGLDVNDAFVQALHRHLGLGAEEKKRARFI